MTVEYHFTTDYMEYIHTCESYHNIYCSVIDDKIIVLAVYQYLSILVAAIHCLFMSMKPLLLYIDVCVDSRENESCYG